MFIQLIGVACMLHVIDPSSVSHRVIHFRKSLLRLHFAEARLNMAMILFPSLASRENIAPPRYLAKAITGNIWQHFDMDIWLKQYIAAILLHQDWTNCCKSYRSN